MNWYIEVLKKYFVFDGRAHRTEYWMFTLVNFVVSFVLGFVDGMLFESQVLATLYTLGVLFPALGAAVRRLHDTGRSGWWLLLGLIPILGTIAVIVLLALEGEPEANEHGPNPWGAAA